VIPAEEIPWILARFGLPDVAVAPVEGGHINRSWKVVPRSSSVGVAGGPGRESLLLQRINPEVFRDGALVLRNVAAVCDHLQQSAHRLGLDQPERRVLRLVRPTDGGPGVQGHDGACWRLLHYIEGTRSWQRAESLAVAREAGRTFGLFQRLLADYEAPPLLETIPGFHDTRRRMHDLVDVVRRDPVGRVAGVAAEIRLALSKMPYADVLPGLGAAGELPTRVVHNDAKVGNVLFDRQTGEGLAVVDLDTVMPGTLLSDVGDLIRSMASPTDEDEPDLSRMVVSPGVIQSLIEGFLGGSRDTLARTERELLIFSGILLTCEQAVRFLTDYLDGDHYFRVTRPAQNLDRARSQFQLLALLEAERGSLERMVAGLGPGVP
jgi:Phosphotransferase enzyme family